jgi:PST family polysaccharide transporter
MSKILIRNISGLAVINGLGYLCSLAIIPYLLRIYGPDNWGKLIFVSTVTNYFIWFTNWGFTQGAVKKIARKKDSKEKNILFCNYWFSQGLLLLVSLVFYITVLSLNSSINGIDRSLFVLSFALVFSNVIFPSWYFIALEQIFESAFFQFLPKLLSAILIFLFIRHPNDLEAYLIIISLSSLLVSLAGALIMFKYNKIIFTKPNLKQAILLLKTDFVWFRIGLISTLLSLIIPTYIGLFRNMVELAHFNIAEKIKSAAIIILHPISHSLYPRMNYLFNKSIKEAFYLAKNSFIILFSLSGLTSLIIFIYSKDFLFFLGGNAFEEATSFLRIISILPLISTINSFFVEQIIQPNNSGHAIEKIYLFNLFFILFFIYPSMNFFGINGIAYLIVTSEIMMLLLNSYKVNNLFPFFKFLLFNKANDLS